MQTKLHGGGLVRKRGVHPARVLNWLVLIILCLMTLYPFWYIIVMSLSTYGDVLDYKLLLWPKGFTLSNLAYVFNSNEFGRIYLNTGFVVVVGTVLSLAATLLLAYPLSQKFIGSGVVRKLVFFTMLFSGGMIPTYLVVRATGLLNSLWALILPVMINPFNVFLMINYLKTIPESLAESAQLDGAGVLTTLVRIILPLSLPGIATIVLFYAVGYWNSFFDAVLYMSKRENWTLQVLLREILITIQPDMLGSGNVSATDDPSALMGPTVKMATVVTAVVPIMLIYPFMQKYFIQGVMVGAVKG